METVVTPTRNGGAISYIARLMGQIMQEKGMVALFALILLGVVIWLVVGDIRTINAQHNAIAVEQTAMREDVKVLSGSMGRVVVLLESIDRQLCLGNARTETERRQCVAPPR